MAKVTGVDKVRKRLDGITGPYAVKQIGKALYAAADLIAKDAQVSIMTGSASSGRHVPSLPGEAPNNDLGTLVSGIETALVGPLHVQVRSNAPYSIALEFGTSKMAERPFMRPALARNREEALDIVRAAVADVIRKTGG